MFMGKKLPEHKTVMQFFENKEFTQIYPGKIRLSIQSQEKIKGKVIDIITHSFCVCRTLKSTIDASIQPNL